MRLSAHSLHHAPARRLTAGRVLHLLVVLAWAFAAAGIGAVWTPAPVAAASANLATNPENGATATATASGSYNATYAPGKAIDGQQSTYWALNGCPAGRWWRITWSVAQTVDRIEVESALDDYGTGVFVKFSDGTQTTVVSLPQAGEEAVVALTAAKTGITWLEVWPDGSGVGNCGLREVQVYHSTIAPAPTPTPAPNDPGVAPIDQPVWFDVYPENERCSYSGVGSTCTWTRSQLGKNGTETACGVGFSEAQARDTAGRPILSCADGWPGQGHATGAMDCDHVLQSLPHIDGVAADCPESVKQYRTWYVGRVVGTSAVRVLIDAGLITLDGSGGYLTCNPFTSGEAQWDACGQYNQTGAAVMIAVEDPGQGGETHIFQGDRLYLRGSNPGCYDSNGPPFRWGGDTYESGPSTGCTDEVGDYTTSILFDLPGSSFTGRIYLRALAQPAPNLRQGECPPLNCWGYDDESKQQVIGVRPLMAVATTGYWQNSVTQAPEEQTPPLWPSCHGSADDWGDTASAECWNSEQFAPIGADGRSNEGFPNPTPVTPEQCKADPLIAGCSSQYPGIGIGCQWGDGVLDVAGHLAYIGCLIAGLPGAILGGIAGMLNTLFVPTEIGDTWDRFWDTAQTRAPFAWASEVADLLGTFGTAGPPAVLTATIMGAAVTIPIGTFSTVVGDWRWVMAGAIWVLCAWTVWGNLRGSVGAHDE